MTRKIVVMSLISIVLLALECLGLGAQTPGPYAYATVSYPGSTSTTASGIDISGRVVGWYVDTSGTTHGFLFNNGDYINLDYPGAQWTAAFGLNNAGQIVGGYGPNASTGRRGFLSNGATFSSLQVPGSVDTVARGINSRGQIVGDSAGADGMRRGFLFSAGSYTTIELAGRGGSSAHGINDSGHVVGSAGTGASAVGFLFESGRYTPIQPSGSRYAIAYGLNESGDIVGQVRGPQPPVQGFRRAGTDVQTVAAPDGATSWDARGINNLGEIVGTMIDREGRTVGYRASPAGVRSAPLPTSLSTAAAPPRPAGAAVAPAPAAPAAVPANSLREIVVLDRKGTLLVRRIETTPISIVSISPDGGRVAYASPTGPLMTLDVPGGTTRPIGPGFSPVGWSPDGTRITHLDRRNGVLGIYITSSTGAGGEELLLTEPNGIYHWTGDGRFVIGGSDTNFVAIPVTPGARTPIVVLSQLEGSGPRISPDNRFVGYTSTQGGTRGIWLRPSVLGDRAAIVAAGSPRKVSSVDAWGMTRWRSDSKELYYIATDGGVMAVPIGGSTDSIAGAPVQLFRAPAAFPLNTVVGQHADVSGDGQRFVFLLTAALR